MSNKLYRQLSTHPIHLKNTECKPACGWFACFVMTAVQLRAEEKVMFD